MDTTPSTFIKTLMAGLFGILLILLFAFAINYEKTNNFVQYANGALQRGATLDEINETSQQEYSGSFTVSNLRYLEGKSLGDDLTYTITQTLWLPTFSGSTPKKSLFTTTTEETTQVLSRY
ncbi:MAG TPA: hypothetical protein VGC17_02290 [Lactovum miscens]|uniref:hypothetical protein n=1 Tax=Lactovum miscens TaxID=190387 RepID=UPI002ED88121